MRGCARVSAVFQVLIGLALAITVMSFYFSSSLPMWEYRSPDGSYVLGWRTAVVFLLILAATQWISLLAFGAIRRRWERRRRHQME